VPRVASNDKVSIVVSDSSWIGSATLATRERQRSATKRSGLGHSPAKKGEQSGIEMVGVRKGLVPARLNASALEFDLKAPSVGGQRLGATPPARGRCHHCHDVRMVYWTNQSRFA
jgi:DNA-directed RNA polymerase subunit M/transcription elongation factor TFIIS